VTCIAPAPPQSTLVLARFLAALRDAAEMASDVDDLAPADLAGLIRHQDDAAYLLRRCLPVVVFAIESFDAALEGMAYWSDLGDALDWLADNPNPNP